MKSSKSADRELKVENWEHANVAMGLYAMQAAQLAQHQAALDSALARVRATYQREFELLGGEISANESALKKFAVSRKGEFKPAPNGDGRSYEHAGVVLGFRQSPGRVEIRKEEEAIEWLRDFREGAFVRIVHQANREALLDNLREAKDTRLVETLAAHGIRFEQKDKFFLEVVSGK